MNTMHLRIFLELAIRPLWFRIFLRGRIMSESRVVHGELLGPADKEPLKLIEDVGLIPWGQEARAKRKARQELTTCEIANEIARRKDSLAAETLINRGDERRKVMANDALNGHLVETLNQNLSAEREKGRAKLASEVTVSREKAAHATIEALVELDNKAAGADHPFFKRFRTRLEKVAHQIIDE